MRQPLKISLCESCNYSTNAGSGEDQCPECGSKLIKKCPRCKKEITDNNHNHCSYCGYEYRGRK